MSSKHTITIVDISNRQSTGEAEVAELSTSERLGRASLRGGIFTAVAVVCVLVPMLHFVLVPGFFITAIVAFIVTFRQTHLIESIRGTCPACSQPIEFTRLKFLPLLKESCPKCRHVLKLSMST